MAALKKINGSTLKTDSVQQDTVGLVKQGGEPPAQVVKPEPLKELLVWSSPTRVFKRRNREFFTTIGAIVALLAIILFFLQEWLLIVVMIALAFYGYVNATIEPDETEHKLTNRGVVTGGRLYPWGALGRFWITQKWGQKTLQIENFGGFPGRLTLHLGKTEEKAIKDIVSQYLLHETPEKTWTDKASEWLSARVPLETND
jgi:hypothetical protein